VHLPAMRGMGVQYLLVWAVLVQQCESPVDRQLARNESRLLTGGVETIRRATREARPSCGDVTQANDPPEGLGHGPPSLRGGGSTMEEQPRMPPYEQDTLSPLPRAVAHNACHHLLR